MVSLAVMAMSHARTHVHIAHQSYTNMVSWPVTTHQTPGTTPGTAVSLSGDVIRNTDEHFQQQKLQSFTVTAINRLLEYPEE